MQLISTLPSSPGTSSPSYHLTLPKFVSMTSGICSYWRLFKFGVGQTFPMGNLSMHLKSYVGQLSYSPFFALLFWSHPPTMSTCPCFEKFEYLRSDSLQSRPLMGGSTLWIIFRGHLLCCSTLWITLCDSEMFSLAFLFVALSNIWLEKKGSLSKWKGIGRRFWLG